MLEAADNLKNLSVGVTVFIRLSVGFRREDYNKYLKEYNEDIIANPYRYAMLRETDGNHCTQDGIPLSIEVNKLEISKVIFFVLEMPFADLPFYINSISENVRKLVASRLVIGK